MHIVEMLLDGGADVNAPEGYAIQAAAAQGHYEVVQELIKRGADVNACTTNENFTEGTALQGAIESGQTEIVRLLLESGADPNHGSGECAPPIIAAARGAEVEILDLLVKAKPKIDVFGGPDMSTPLIYAAGFMPVSSLEQLLSAGADINLVDNDGDTALIIASVRGDVDAVRYLLENGADIMQSSPRNGNALQAALDGGDEDCLRLLVNHASALFGALKKSMDSGNMAVTSVIRSATSTSQGLNYDDDPQASPQQLNHAKANGDMNTSETRSTSLGDNINNANGGSYGAPRGPGINGPNNVSSNHDVEGDSITNVVSLGFSGLTSHNNVENNSEGPKNGHDDSQNEEPAIDTDEFQSEAATEVPTDDDDTGVALSINDDGNEADDGSVARVDPDIPDAVSQLSNELQSALGNQISLFNQYPKPEEEDAPLDDHEAATSTRGIQEQDMTGPLDREPPVIVGESLPGPAELPAQIFVKRKPAPVASRQETTPSPKTVDTRYEAPPTNIGYEAHTATTAYHPVQDETQYHQVPTLSSSTVTQPVPPPSSASYQSAYGQLYQSSQSSQAAPVATTSYPQQQRQQQQQQQTQYQKQSLYDGSQYGRPEARYAGQQQAYTAYHPNVYQQQQHAYTPEQIQAYQNQAYDEQYRNYYASLKTAQQQQQQQQQQQKQQQSNEQSMWDDERPSLKPQRSSFFTGGVKSTLGKAKVVGNGFLNRKHTP